MSSNALAWLTPVRPVIDQVGMVDWTRLRALAVALEEALSTYQVTPSLPAGAERSQRLRAIRLSLANMGYADGAEQPALFQLLAQWICGYQDLDLRDATGLGHGQLIGRHGSLECRRQWLPRLRAGELAGIAITEQHGGSRPAAGRTHAVPDGRRWLINGRKTWISRLTEAAVFLVFFRDPSGHLTAAAVDAAEPGLRRQLIPPSGLAGWSWGILDLDAVPVNPQEVLRGDGMTLLRRHFSTYRPLVTATALGAAAAVFDAVTTELAARQSTGDLPQLRDTTLVKIGLAYARLTSALLGVAAAACLADTHHPQAEASSAAIKAHGIDTAHDVVGELALLVGAAGFQADSQIAKTRRDLDGLLYADGIHDSLYRTAGKYYTAHHAPDTCTSQAVADLAVQVPVLSGDPAPLLAQCGDALLHSLDRYGQAVRQQRLHPVTDLLKGIETDRTDLAAPKYDTREV